MIPLIDHSVDLGVLSYPASPLKLNSVSKGNKKLKKLQRDRIKSVNLESSKNVKTSTINSKPSDYFEKYKSRPKKIPNSSLDESKMNGLKLQIYRKMSTATHNVKKIW